jgi:hypothetical protein
MLSGLPPKADFPILELLPPPASCERRHRGLAQHRNSGSRAVESRAAAVDRWAGDVAYSISQNLVSTSDAVTAANATRNAVIRSWIMAAG